MALRPLPAAEIARAVSAFVYYDRVFTKRMTRSWSGDHNCDLRGAFSWICQGPTRANVRHEM
jgi:hypothetical protein